MSCGQWPSNDRQIITLHWVCQASCLFFYRQGQRKLKARRRKGRQRHQFIINAKLKPVSGCFAVCPGISHPPPCCIFFILQSAALTSLEDIMVPCHQESPLFHRQSFILGGIALLFHFVRARVCETRTFAVEEGDACNSISSCLPEWKLETVRWDQCQDEKLLRRGGMIVVLVVGVLHF